MVIYYWLMDDLPIENSDLPSTDTDRDFPIASESQESLRRLPPVQYFDLPGEKMA